MLRFGARKQISIERMADDVPPPPPPPPGVALVEASDNHIYFYTDVTPANCLALLQALRNADERLCVERLRFHEQVSRPIYLHIFSDGGDALAAFAVADQIACMKTPVHSIAEGICASAATLIAFACAHRYMQPNALILIHQLSSMMAGTHEQFEDAVLMQNMVMERLVNFYTEHSHYTSEGVIELLKRDTWFGAESSLAAGLVDELWTKNL